jgi:hypothetical protein
MAFSGMSEGRIQYRVMMLQLQLPKIIHVIAVRLLNGVFSMIFFQPNDPERPTTDTSTVR